MSAHEEKPAEPQDDDTSGATEHYDAAIVARARAVLYEPPEQIGPYRIFERIGGGGMGDVYRAEQREGVRRPVAIKLIRPGFDTRQVITRFEAERQALAMMHHPHIAQVYAAGNDDTGRPYFVMEFVPGKPVTQFADENKLTVRQRLELFLQICGAISHAHTKLIIHRDIKSGNVLAYFNDEKQPVVKVIDFGVAKALSGNSLSDATLYTAHGEILGTYDSMSPEQAAGSSDIDTRTDVYSLGVLLYELLTGAKPFDYARVADLEIRRIIRDVEPPPPSTRLSSMGKAGEQIAAARRSQLEALAKELGSELEWIPLMAMRKERDRRYESPAALAADIERYLGGEPLHAGPETLIYRLKKYVSRRKGALVSAGVILLLLLVGSIVSTMLAIRARKAEQVVTSQLATVSQKEAEAQRERDNAVQANERADKTARSARRALSDSYVDRGVAASDDGDPARAALWFVNAWKLDTGDPDRELVHRIRINDTLGRIVRLRNEKPTIVSSPKFVSGNFLQIVRGDKSAVRLVHADSGKSEYPTIELDAAVVDAVLSPDGKSILTKTKTDDLRLWDAATATPLTPAIHHDWGDYKFSPDAKYLAITFSDCLRLFDAHSGIEAKQRISEKDVFDFAFSADHRKIATASNSGVLRVWDLVTCQPTTPIMKHEHRVNNVVFSRDGTRVASESGGMGDGERSLQLWNAETGVAIIKPIELSSDAEVKFSHNETALMAVGEGEVSVLWNPGATSQRLVKIEPEDTGYVHDAVFSPNDTVIAITTEDRSVRTWNPFSGKPISPPIANQGQIIDVEFSSDGRILATASDDRSVRLWDAVSGEVVAPPLWHGDQVQKLKFAPDSGTIETLSRDGIQRVWSVSADGPGRKFRVRSWSDTMSAVFSPDGKTIATADEHGASDWDAASWRPLSPPIVPKGTWRRGVAFYAVSKSGQEILLHDVYFSPNGTVIASKNDWTVDLFVIGAEAGAARSIDARAHDVVFDATLRRLATINDKCAQVWDVATGKAIGAEISCPKGIHVAFSHDGRFLLTTGGNAVAQVWNASTGVAVSPPINHPDMVLSGAFSPDDKVVVTYSGDDVVRAWDWRSAKRLPWSKEYGAWLGNTRFSADGKTMIRHGDYGLQLWDAIADKPISPIMPGASGTFSPNDLLLLTISDARGNGRVPARVWDAKTGKPVTSVLSRKYLAPASFSPDGGSLLTVDDDSIVVLPLQPTKWSLPDCEQLAELLSASRVDDGGGVIPIAGDEWRQRWNELRAKMPEFFRAAEVNALPKEMLPSYKRAVEMRVSAAKSDPEKKALAWSLSAESLVERNSDRIEEALLLAETAVRLDETNLGAQDNLAAAYLRAGRYGQALTIYERFQGAHYDATWYDDDMKDVVFGRNAHSLLKTSGALKSGTSADPALSKIRELLQKTSGDDSEDVWDRVISASESEESYKQIRDALQEAIKQKSRDRHNLNALGYAQYRLGDFTAAISTLNRPEAINPDNDSLEPGERRHMADWAFLAMANMKLGHDSESLKYLTKFRQVYSAGDKEHQKRYKDLASEVESVAMASSDIAKSESNKISPSDNPPAK